MSSTTQLTTTDTGAAYCRASVDARWLDVIVGAGMAKNRFAVIGHPSTTRRPPEVSP